DTHGTARKQLQSLPCKIEILPTESQAKAKQAFLGHLPHDGVAAIGNGRNDLHMLQCAQLAIAVMGPEGMATEIILAADLVVTDIHAAFDLLLRPRRLLAGLQA
ncbi:MAG TPA: ATPase P, partial [Chloroflexota bacterium]|nr:ATPase P [Chloroflexota bacterium]